MNITVLLLLLVSCTLAADPDKRESRIFVPVDHGPSYGDVDASDGPHRVQIPIPQEHHHNHRYPDDAHLLPSPRQHGEEQQENALSSGFYPSTHFAAVHAPVENAIGRPTHTELYGPGGLRFPVSLLPVARPPAPIHEDQSDDLPGDGANGVGINPQRVAQNQAALQYGGQNNGGAWYGVQGGQGQGIQGLLAQYLGGLGPVEQFQGAQGLVAQFQGDQGQNAQSQGVQIQNTQFHGDQGQIAQFQGDQGQNAQFQGAQFQGTQGQNAQFQGAQGQNAQFQGAQGQIAQFQGAQGQNSQFQGTQGQNSQFQGAQGQNAQFQGAQGQNPQFQVAQGQNAQFQGAQGQIAQLQGVQDPVSQFQGLQGQVAQFQGAHGPVTQLLGVQRLLNGGLYNLGQQYANQAAAGVFYGAQGRQGQGAQGQASGGIQNGDIRLPKLFVSTARAILPAASTGSAGVASPNQERTAAQSGVTNNRVQGQATSSAVNQLQAATETSSGQLSPGWAGTHVNPVFASLAVGNMLYDPHLGYGHHRLRTQHHHLQRLLLKHYGRYLPYGIGPYGLYGFSASNNLHNSEAFGFYKHERRIK